jgi:outer membrane protein TolC
MRKLILVFLLIFLATPMIAQKTDVLNLKEYLVQLKKHHPIIKQANLVIDESEAKLLKARGAFDPKFELDYDTKDFKEKDYFDKFSSTFKIPTWYGVELKGNFENNSGDFLNPENTVPANGLYNIGVSLPLARDLLINRRMATLKQAKIYKQQAAVDNQLMVNKIMFDASLSYFYWLKSYKEKEVYQTFLENSKLRLNAIKRSYELGEKPAIDTIEAKIALNDRILNLEKAKLNFQKATFELSNYLWINEVPVEIREEVVPDINATDDVDSVLKLNDINIENRIETHPKLQSLAYKLNNLSIEKKLKRNNLLPKVDFEYNFINQTPSALNSFSNNNYKSSISAGIPIFLRKERADLKLANYKLQAIDFETKATRFNLQNKINATRQEIDSYGTQSDIVRELVADYTTMLKGEERKFEIGGSSLFLINSRESKLIESKLKEIVTENLFLNSKAKLFNVLGFD